MEKQGLKNNTQIKDEAFDINITEEQFNKYMTEFDLSESTHVIKLSENKTLYCKIPDEATKEFENMINSFMIDKKL